MNKSNHNVYTRENAVKPDGLASQKPGTNNDTCISPVSAGHKDDFKLEWLPDKLHPIALAIQKHSRAPLPAVALLMDSVLSMAIGKGLGIHNPKAGFDTLANIQVLVAMLSGSGKSVAGKAAFKPFKACVNDAVEKFSKEVLPGILVELEEVNKGIKALKDERNLSGENRARYQELFQRKAELERLQQHPQFFMDDTTIPAAENILERNNGVASFFSLEARKALNNILGLSPYGNSSGTVTSESIFTYGYSQDPIVTNRVGGRDINVPNPWISSYLLVQPDKAWQALGNPELKDSGFLARQIIFYTKERKPKKEPGEKIQDHIDQVWDELVRAIFYAYRIGTGARSKDETDFVVMTPEQCKIIWEYDKWVDSQIHSGERAYLQEGATRLPEQAVRLSTIHHAAKYGNEAHITPLDNQTLLDAIEMVEWFFRRLMDLTEDKAATREMEVVQKAVEYARKQDSRSIKPGILISRHWVSSTEEAQHILDNAREYFERVEKPRTDGKPGKPSIAYVLRK